MLPAIIDSFHFLISFLQDPFLHLGNTSASGSRATASFAQFRFLFLHCLCSDGFRPNADDVAVCRSLFKHKTQVLASGIKVFSPSLLSRVQLYKSQKSQKSQNEVDELPTHLAVHGPQVCGHFHHTQNCGALLPRCKTLMGVGMFSCGCGRISCFSLMTTIV